MFQLFTLMSMGINSFIVNFHYFLHESWKTKGICFKQVFTLPNIQSAVPLKYTPVVLWGFLTPKEKYLMCGQHNPHTRKDCTHHTHMTDEKCQWHNAWYKNNIREEIQILLWFFILLLMFIYSVLNGKHLIIICVCVRVCVCHRAYGGN